MSEPVTYYDLDGAPRVMHSPTVAAAMVAAGLLLTEPPAFASLAKVYAIDGCRYSEADAPAAVRKVYGCGMDDVNWLDVTVLGDNYVTLVPDFLPAPAAAKRQRKGGK